MPVTVMCEDCETKYSVSKSSLGKRVKCNRCGHVFVIEEQMPARVKRTSAVAIAGAARAPSKKISPARNPSPVRSRSKVESSIEPPAVAPNPSRIRRYSAAALFGVALVVVGSLLAYKFYGGQPSLNQIPNQASNRTQNQTGINRENSSVAARLNDAQPASFSDAASHGYMDLQAHQRRTANNLDILTTEVFIYRDRHNGQYPKSLDDLDLHYGTGDPRVSPFDSSMGKKGYAFMPMNIGPDMDRVMLFDIAELQKTGSTHVVMSKYHQIRTMQRDQLIKQPGVSLEG